MTTGSTTTGAPVREQGFWSSLFGAEPEHEHDTTVYDRSLEGGSTVVTVKAPDQHVTRVTDILERHNPIDIDERAASYGIGQTTTTRTTNRPVATEGASAQATDGGTIQLSEESLVIGKRAVNRGTTRIRRYVVETPVEEQVTLHQETVSVERRPVTDGRPVTDVDFSDKVIEMTETDEEAVVGKTARVKEEVVIRKDATERTETVRDTVRSEDVEITQDGSVERTADTPARTAADPSKPKV